MSEGALAEFGGISSFTSREHRHPPKRNHQSSSNDVRERTRTILSTEYFFYSFVLGMKIAFDQHSLEFGLSDILP